MEIPRWDSKNPHVPIDREGNWMHYPDRYYHSYVEYVQPFAAKLKISGMRSGRSAKYLILDNVETGTEYPMFIADFLHFIKKGNVIEGILQGTWTVAKRGANYGIKHI